MSICIVYPDRAHSAYKIAAETFAKLAQQVSDLPSQIMTDLEFTAAAPSADPVVLIGNDAVNSVTAELYLTKKIAPLGLQYGKDNYLIRTLSLDGGTPCLLLAGGRPRAAIYAVYRYFEHFCGCRWFWDGDRIPKAKLPFSELDLKESPRFDYRGLRYFAHRSLHRFQAEHWSLENWTVEIDWILKKRLNLFMLRIGMDDLFQKAFPDVVSYPERDEPLPEAGPGYNDRTLFWSLEYRGELRKKLLAYAFERDLMHPEDCGTVSHWYSRTPLDFLNKVKPDLLPQCNKNYNDPTGRVWDVRKKENIENYLKLTDTHVREYGRPELFHTIGLGERLYSADKEENKRMKLFVYHQIATRIGETYPNAPLLIASWDLWMHFTPEEVRELVSEFDPTQTIILDYTSDSMRSNNFTKWGVVNRFPWIFGMFSGYEPDSEIRGLYGLTNERLQIAKADPMCRGMVFWPELSHGDPFAIEYFAQSAWDHETPSISERLAQYCADRYPASLSERMHALWQDFMPIVELTAWSVEDTYYQTGRDLFINVGKNVEFDRESAELYQSKVTPYRPLRDTAVGLLRRLADLPSEDAMTRRDLYDIARTVIGRFLNAALLETQLLYVRNAPLSTLEKAMSVGEALIALLAELLGSHEDYSLLTSLEKLRSVTETNPNFEATLKANAEANYCRSYIYENVAYLYCHEIRLLFSEVRKAAASDRPIDREAIDGGLEQIRANYFSVPLWEMKKPTLSYSEVVLRAAEILESWEL